MKRVKGRGTESLKEEVTLCSFSLQFSVSRTLHSPRHTGRVCSHPKASREALSSFLRLPGDWSAPSKAE